MMIVSLASSEREAGSVTIAQCVQVKAMKGYNMQAGLLGQAYLRSGSLLLSPPVPLCVCRSSGAT